MRQKDFFELYYKLQDSAYGKIKWSEPVTPRVNIETCYCDIGHERTYFLGRKSDREFKITIDNPYIYQEDRTFKGFLISIDEVKGKLKFYIPARKEYLNCDWDKVELRKLNYTYRELMEKM